MFSNARSCSRKSVLLYSLFALLLGFFACIFLKTDNTYAASLSITSFDIHQAPDNIHGFSWINGLGFNEPRYPFEVDEYRFNTGTINANGNFATIHFETNIVASQSPNSPDWYKFFNLDALSVRSCGSSVGHPTIRSSSISYTTTRWTGTIFGLSGANQTLTIYGDIVLGDLTQGSQYFACSIGATNSFYTVLSNNTPAFGFEQQPTTITFTNDQSEALSRMQVEVLANINNSIDGLNDGEQQRWQQDKDDMADKQSELENDVGDLSLSASTPTNYFTSLFLNPFSANPCVTLTYIPALFNAPSFTACSPFPSTVRSILYICSNLFILGLLLRLYFKTLKGGLNG